MSSNPISSRGRLVVAGVLALSAAALSAADAGAATIHACVKPKSGATRIVGAKAKCRHGEQKLSWNTTGPTGPTGPRGSNGPSGAEGKAGANGAGSVYAAEEPEAVPIGAETTFLTKVLPPGSYIATAKTTIVADAGKPELTNGFCALSDQPGTTGGGEGTVLDITGWEVELAKEGATEFAAEVPLGLEGSMTSSVTSTLSMGCVDLKGAPPQASITKMHALSVTSVL